MSCVIIETECTACGVCAEICPEHAIAFFPAEGAYRVDARACTHCGACKPVCDYDAVLSVEWEGISAWA